jgi:hypothetical protein
MRVCEICENWSRVRNSCIQIMEPVHGYAGGSGQCHAGNHALTSFFARSGDENSKGQALHVGCVAASSLSM